MAATTPADTPAGDKPPAWMAPTPASAVSAATPAGGGTLFSDSDAPTLPSSDDSEEGAARKPRGDADEVESNVDSDLDNPSDFDAPPGRDSSDDASGA